MRQMALAASVVLLTAVGATAQDARSVVDGASRAMGLTGLKSVVYSGSAAQGNFGQSRTISFGLASTSLRNYTRAIDFEQGSARTTADALPPAVPGAPAPMPRPFEEIITPTSPWAQQLELWITPWGFLRGAAMHNATAKSRKVNGVRYTEVTWSPAMKAPSGQPYRVVGYISADLFVDKVETWVEHPVLGDLHIEATYGEYRDANGLKVPTKVAQRRVGMETFVAGINHALANPTDLAQLLTPSPPSGRGGGAGAGGAAPTVPVVASERLADGVYRITGGYVALAVDFREYVVVLEGGQSEARGLAVIAETRRLFPNKRIKYVVNTHPHFDHLSGLAPFAAEGITILTDDNSKYFVEQALASPRTLVGDALARSKKKPKVEGVIEKMVIGDETHTIELHHVAKLEHSDAMLIAYLPKEKILFSGDFAPPGQGQSPNPSIVTLVDNIDRLNLDFDRHITVHAPNPDRPMSRTELVALVRR